MKKTSTWSIKTTAEQLHFITSQARWGMLKTAKKEMKNDANFLKIEEIRRMLQKLDDKDIIIITTMPF